MTSATMPRRHLEIYDILRARWPMLLAAGLAFAVFYYTALLLIMIIKFRQLPNYFVPYDWPANVLLIIQSTPSVTDTLAIIKAEWLFEIGYMNYEFGLGIAEWSLFLSPFKTLAVMTLGTMLALLFILVRHSAVCSAAKKSIALAGGLGAVLMSISLMSLSWVVCCATPTWIVGLAILGLGVSTSLWLEPAGIWLNMGGFMALSMALLILAGFSPRLINR